MRSNLSLSVYSLALLLLCGMLGGCSPNINNLANFPERYRNKEISLTGEVTSIMEPGVPGVWFYAIQDNSGQMWIETQQEPPALGDQVTVKAIFKTSVTIGDHNFQFLLIDQGRKQDKKSVE